MPVYEIELEDGRVFEVEVGLEIPDTPRGRALLQRLVAEQHRNEQFSRQAMPVQTAVGDIGRGIVGGVRDVGQQAIDLPVGILNTITEFISPDPPGGPRRPQETPGGPRRAQEARGGPGGPGGSARSQEAPGGPGRHQEGRFDMRSLSRLRRPCPGGIARACCFAKLRFSYRFDCVRRPAARS